LISLKITLIAVFLVRFYTLYLNFTKYKKYKIMTKNLLFIAIIAVLYVNNCYSQALRIPQNSNFPASAGRKVGITEIEVKWNAPGVKGREGKIWGTDIAYFGTSVLGFGSNVESPWRAGADECTTISFSTDVSINGKALPAGKYALFMQLSPDSTTLIFNKNTRGWGSYFYDKSLDVMRVSTKQKKNQPNMVERLAYNFNNQTENSVEISLDWERWSIPFKVEVDIKKTTLAYIKREMSSELGFDPPSLELAANWCVNNDVNLEEANNWITSATSPNLGGSSTFRALSTKSKILEKLGKKDEAISIMQAAIDKGSAIELHQHGRQLLAQKKISEAMAIFEMNHKKHNGAWPTNGGLMRGYSASGNLKKALEYAKLALAQAPDDVNKRFIESAIKSLEEGKAL
jgi:tetratricopeptide (TPR) repeat protein